MTLAIGTGVALFVMAGFLVLFSRSVQDKLNQREVKRVVTLMVVGAIVHLLVLSLRYVIEGLPVGFEFYRDQQLYHGSASFLADEWRSGHFPDTGFLDEFGLTRPGYTYTLAGIYFVFGDHMFLGSLLNLTLFLGIAILMYHIALRLSGKIGALITLGLVLAYPAFADWTYFLLRDLILTFFTVVIAWMLVTYSTGVVSARRLLLIVLPLIPFIWYRIEMAVVYAPLVLLHLLRNTPGAPVANRLRPLLLFMLFAAVALVLLQPGERIDNPFESRLLGKTVSHADEPGFLVGANLFDIGEIADRITDSPGSFATATYESVYLTFWGPTWFFARSGPSFDRPFQVLGAVFMIMLMPFVVLGVVETFRTQGNRATFLLGVLLVLTVTLIFTGAPLRIRLPMMPFVLMFGGIGLRNFHQARFYYLAYLFAMMVWMLGNLLLLDPNRVRVFLVILVSILGLPLILLGLRAFRSKMSPRVGRL